MCSIAGIINGTGIEKMLAAQRHRAPDEQGIFRKPGLELGMGRLKILDLKSSGLAPYQDGDIILLYNGEVFNYPELKKQLALRGYKFRTASDIEVLAKGWLEWGPRVLEKLNGMFAFAIYDQRRQKLFLARDVVGEKPLFFYRSGKKFIFASEAKAIASVIEPRYREDRFFDSFQHILGKTPWDGVEEVRPAHYIEYDIRKSRLAAKRYWTFQPRKINVKNAAEELGEILKDAVKIRLRSDVPVGLYYSGGLDSSILNKIHHFNHRFYFDARNSAVKKDFFRNIQKALWHLDFPVGSFGFFGLWKLAEAAAKKVRVVLSGEGADEVFGGYVRYLPIARDYEMRRKFPSYGYIFNKYNPLSYLDAFAKITARNGDLEYVRERLRPFFEMFDDPINAMGFADFNLILPSLLQMNDRMASAFGLENRSPFLDRRVIEFGFSLPPEFKISGLSQKVLLRQIAEEVGLDRALGQEKSGLAIPYNKWIGRDDWDRSEYFKFLNKEWRKINWEEDA